MPIRVENNEYAKKVADLLFENRIRAEADYSDENFAIGKPALGDVIKLRMTELGITQTKLAEILGLSASRISDYITGKAEPTLKVARDLSVKLDIAPAVVLGV